MDELYNGPKLVIALDNIDKQRAREIMEQLKEFKWKVVFKVNDLLFELWAKWITELLSWEWDTSFKIAKFLLWKKVAKSLFWKTPIQAMLDPKWHDISETIINYLRKLEKYPELAERTEFLTVHASNWRKALKKLMDEKKELWLKTKIFAVTALTSLDDKDTQSIFDETAKHSVLKLAKEALDVWVDWIVCSAKEAKLLREVFSDYSFEIITPWVRFDWWENHDQKRVTTPAEAIENWSSHIVMWRPILESKDIILAVNRFFNEIAWIIPEVKWEYQFEKLLYNWEWIDLLKHIGAVYERIEWWKYCRLASWLLSNVYLNIWVTERDYLVLERAWRELAEQVSEKNIKADVIMWAQMWSVRLSWVLGEKLWIETSIYTEKWLDNNEEMVLNRHDIDLTWKKIILSEDIVTWWTTLDKMIELVKKGWWEVVWITCVWNRFWKDEFKWIPLISCFIPPEFDYYWDNKTPELKREWIKNLPEWALISEKPKNDWPELIESMKS